MSQATLFNVSAETVGASRKSDTASHYRRLLSVLGNGADWDYRGDCVDLGERGPRGECSCGHPGLRYIFTIHHKGGKTARVGSTCIGHFQAVNPSMVDSIQADSERLEQAAADRLKAARAAVQDATAETLLAELNGAYWQLERLIASGNGRRVAWHIWADGFCYRRAVHRLEACDTSGKHPCLRVKQYKRVSALVSHLRKRLAILNGYIASPWV